MTTPNPTPTTREREAAHITKISLKYFRDNWQLRWALEQDITAALARERREALTEAAQVARNEKVDADDTRVPEDFVYNNACEDCAAAIDQLRDGEKG